MSHYYRYGAAEETEERFVGRMVDDIESIITREGADTIAAFIAEPVMGTGGSFRRRADTSNRSRRSSMKTTSFSLLMRSYPASDGSEPATPPACIN